MGCNMTWTRFRDLHSGGSIKESFSTCYIEAPEVEAKVIFYNRFGHNPDRVSCTCCGGDYSSYEYDTLEEASHYLRNHEYAPKPYLQSLDDYMAEKDVLIIRSDEIKPEERTGVVPRQGYVWVE